MSDPLIQQLDDVVSEVFALMLNLACTSEASGPARECSMPPASDLTACVRFSGSLEGECTLQLNQCTATELTSNMMGIARDEVELDLCVDAVGELCNMIAGGWKAQQSQHRATCKLSIPIVKIGPLNPPVSGFKRSASVDYYFAGYQLTLHLTCN